MSSSPLVDELSEISFKLANFHVFTAFGQEKDPDLGGGYAETGGLQQVRRLTCGADQRKDQPPHSLRRPRDDRMVERGWRPCRAAQSRKRADRVDAQGQDGVPLRQRTAALQAGRPSS